MQLCRDGEEIDKERALAAVLHYTPVIPDYVDDEKHKSTVMKILVDVEISCFLCVCSLICLSLEPRHRFLACL